ncbi:hypothetical protein HPB51_004975 [Rhipicephalus microplus]|uniref:Uncharacterized protein n=1 Tax=Rhipicephalus microplus TaxID=6941 RepID=A0A9J6EXF3_RHIMP|nr:hypothetical protein HPB51_004975 [Rhipicephalus microplus]
MFSCLLYGLHCCFARAVQQAMIRAPSCFNSCKFCCSFNSVGSAEEAGASGAGDQSTVIPSADTLIGDLLSMDIGAPPAVPPVAAVPPTAAAPAAAMDIFGGGLDSLLGDPLGGAGAAPIPAATPAPLGSTNTTGLLGDIFGLGTTSTFYTPPKQASGFGAGKARGKGLEIAGTFTRRNGQIFMDMTFSNKAMQAMTGFAIQFNKNSFGLAPAQPLQVQAPLQPNFPADASLPLSTTGPVQKMDPLTNLQVAVKNNVDVFYFSCVVPLHVLCVEDGLMDKRVFLATWKDIPAQNELQFTLDAGSLSADQLAQRLQQNNIFTIAKRNVDGQDMLYQSLKLTNGIWVLAELKVQPGNPRITVSSISQIEGPEGIDVKPCRF